MSVDRTTVDLSYPDLVMILLGMRVNTAAGVKTLLGFGPQIAKVAQDLPDGLLSHETFLWSLFPPHAGIRQYWRDFAALEFWSRSAPHREWWKAFLRNSGGTGFWHQPTSCTAVWKRSSMTFQSHSASCVSHRGGPRRAACLLRASGPQPRQHGFADKPAPAAVVPEEDLQSDS